MSKQCLHRWIQALDMMTVQTCWYNHVKAVNNKTVAECMDKTGMGCKISSNIYLAELHSHILPGMNSMLGPASFKTLRSKKANTTGGSIPAPEIMCLYDGVECISTFISPWLLFLRDHGRRQRRRRQLWKYMSRTEQRTELVTERIFAESKWSLHCRHRSNPDKVIKEILEDRATGKGVKSIVEQYYKSTSATAMSGGSWSTTYPARWEQ